MILMDKAQKDLDVAAKLYRRAYNYGYLLAQQGKEIQAQKILDRANAEYDAAKAAFAAARNPTEGSTT